MQLLALDHRLLKPDVVVMDLHMSDLNGIDATRRIVAASPDVRVLVLTMFDDDEPVFAAVRAGARGYLLKGAGGAKIVRAIEAVGDGEVLDLSPRAGPTNRSLSISCSA